MGLNDLWAGETRVGRSPDIVPIHRMRREKFRFNHTTAHTRNGGQDSCSVIINQSPNCRDVASSRPLPLCPVTHFRPVLSLTWVRLFNRLSSAKLRDDYFYYAISFNSRGCQVVNLAFTKLKVKKAPKLQKILKDDSSTYKFFIQFPTVFKFVYLQ